MIPHQSSGRRRFLPPHTCWAHDDTRGFKLKPSVCLEACERSRWRRVTSSTAPCNWALTRRVRQLDWACELAERIKSGASADRFGGPLRCCRTSEPVNGSETSGWVVY